MPVLSPEDLGKRRAAKGMRVDLSPYLDYLRPIQPGHAGQISLEANETKATIKRRVTTAAHRLGKNIKYLRSGEKDLLFEVQPERRS
jgi:hypothetical protein